MRRYLLAFTALVALGLAVSPARPRLASAQAAGTSPIKHVVIIYQENHTFDELLGGVCQTRVQPCNAYVGPVTMADGTIAPNVVEPDIVPYIGHLPASQRLALANKWDRIKGCTASPYLCVTHVDPSDIPNLTALANRFTVSDATFADGTAASFGAHVEIAAGTEDGFVGTNPVNSTTGAAPQVGWGCPSRKDVLWGAGYTYQPSCVPLADGSGAYRATKVPYVPTIMERLERAGLRWHMYAGSSGTAPTDGRWNYCTYFAWCTKNRFNLTYNSSYESFATAASSGTLPSVSFLTADGPTSQHNNTSMAVGDNYIGRMVNAVEQSPEWNSTAILITWDDCGCFYDHVKPPAGLGLRNPMLIVSPYAKPGYTDHTTAVQPYSMLAFIDHVFGLTALTSTVGAAYDYSNAFDFTQPPLPPARMTHQHISAATRAKVRSLARLWRSDST